MQRVLNIATTEK